MYMRESGSAAVPECRALASLRGRERRSARDAGCNARSDRTNGYSRKESPPSMNMRPPLASTIATRGIAAAPSMTPVQGADPERERQVKRSFVVRKAERLRLR